MKYSTIKLNDIANSDGGINLSIWTQGCPHHCKGCFNVETWDFNTGLDFSEGVIRYILTNINKNCIDRNLSILGGEPLCPQNVEGVLDLCMEFRKTFPLKKILLWTGYEIENFDEKQIKILSYIDILIDGKFEECNKDLSLTLRGSSNQRVIDVKQSLTQNKIILYEGE